MKCYVTFCLQAVGLSDYMRCSFKYTAAQKFGISKIFKGVSSAHQGCIYLIKNTEKKNSNIVKSYCNF